MLESKGTSLTHKISNLCFAENLIEFYMWQLLFMFASRESNRKC